MPSPEQQHNTARADVLGLVLDNNSKNQSTTSIDSNEIMDRDIEEGAAKKAVSYQDQQRVDQEMKRCYQHNNEEEKTPIVAPRYEDDISHLKKASPRASLVARSAEHDQMESNQQDQDRIPNTAASVTTGKRNADTSNGALQPVVAVPEGSHSDQDANRSARSSSSTGTLPGAFQQAGGCSVRNARATLRPGDSNASGTLQAIGAVAVDGPMASESSASSSARDTPQQEEIQQDGLVQAHEVSEPATNEDLERAEPMDASGDSSRSLGSRRRTNSQMVKSFSLYALIVLIVLGLILALVLVSKNNSAETVDTHTNGEQTTDPNSATSVPSIHPENAFKEGYLLGILAATPALSESIQELNPQNHSSSSYLQLALDWMLEDPYLMEHAAERVVQRFALTCFFFATQGATWTQHNNWLSYSFNECDWYGADNFRIVGGSEESENPCNPETGLYERLWLPDNNLNGTLPDEIYALSSLESINFWRSPSLQGTLSPKIQYLHRTIKKLSFFDTTFSSTIPTEIGLLSHLEVLYTPTNGLTGTVPKEIVHLTNMQHFTFGKYNQLTGPIPTEIGAMTDLVALGIDNNLLTGELPTELGLLERLRYLNMRGLATMNTTIPTQFGLMSSLFSLHANDCNLHGTLPTELGNIAYFKELILAGNHLSGTVPSEIGRLSAMRWMFLSQNELLQGSLPSELSNLTKMEAWDINGTGIIAETVPPAFADLPDYQDYLACGGTRFPC